MALGFEFPPLPLPFDAAGRDLAKKLLQEHVYGPVSKPSPVSFDGWTSIGGALQVAQAPFPLLLASPPSDRPLPAIAALSFSPVGEALEQTAVWPLEWLASQGWAVAVACVDDIEPDDRERSTGLAISKWAQGLMRIRQWLASDGRFDASRICALGHSRLGKTALVATAFDEGFAGTVAIQSGCGGAAPSRTSCGETVADITRVFPHWFSPRFATYAGREDALPLDQHWLLALCASRPLLLCNAEDDVWANPAGQHEMLLLAASAYGAAPPEMVLGGTVGHRLAHFYRPGRHEVMLDDWRAITDLLNRTLG